MKKIVKIFNNYKSIISYLFFGVLTTLVNVVSYYIFYSVLTIPNVISTIIAWLLAVIFAYITNKLFVFESKTLKFRDVLREIIAFFTCRILTGVLDVAVMYLAVDIMDFNSTLFKLLSNILVIILNYIASKLFIFKNKSGKEKV